MKRLISISLMGLLCLFSSCKQRETSPNEIIEIRTTDAKPLVFEDLFDSVEILLLEDNNKFPMQYVTKMLCWNEFYYLLNYTGQGEQIIVYNLHGKFVKALTQKGKGPKEYSKIGDFDINPETGELLIVDPILKKLLVFDKSLEFVKYHIFDSIQNPRLAAFCPWDNDEYIVSSMTNHTSSIQDYKINIQDFAESYHKGYLPYDEPLIGGSGGQFQLQKLKSIVSFLPRFSSYIYQISEKGCEQSYFLDFDRPTMPEGVRNITFDYPDCIFNQKFVESEKNLIVQIIYNGFLYETHFCKEQRTSRTAITSYYDKINDDRVNLFPIGFASQMLVYYSNSSEITDLIRNFDPYSRCISNPEILDSIDKSEGTGILMFAKYH